MKTKTRDIIILCVGKVVLGIMSYMMWTHLSDFEEHYGLDVTTFLITYIGISGGYLWWLFKKLKKYLNK